MKVIIFIWLTLKSLNSYPQTDQTTISVPANTDYALSMCERISTIVVKPNNLIDICTLGREFEISFKFFVNKLDKNKNLLEAFAGPKEKIRFLRVCSHWKLSKIRIIARVENDVVKAKIRKTPKIKLKTWNTIRIVQEKLHHDLVRKIFFLVELKQFY